MALKIAVPKRVVPKAVAPKRNPSLAAAQPVDSDAVWRLCGWGGSALIAAVALTVTTQSDLARGRLERLASNSPSPAPSVIAQLPPRPPEVDPETLRLRIEVRNLTADRERLAARFAALEQHLNEVTSSIKPPQAAAAATPPASPPSPPPQIEAVAVTAAPISPVPAPINPTSNPLAMPVLTSSVGGWSQPYEPMHEEAPRIAKLETGDVPPVPTPRAIAAEDELTPPTPMPGKAEYGIDLGGAHDMETLRLRWATVKANLGPMLTGLQPVAVRERKSGRTEYRLVVGPMPSYAAARQVCGRFAIARVPCHAAKFNGDSIVQR